MTEKNNQLCSGVSNKAKLAATLVSVTAGTTPAFAGSPLGAGTITFSSSSASAAAIPTMGSIGLILLSGLLAIIALKSYRRAGGITPAIVGLLGIAALASTGGGIHFVQNASAERGIVEVTQPDSYILLEGENSFRNSSGSPLDVSDISLEQNCATDTNSSGDPDCERGDSIADGAMCAIAVSCDRFEVSDQRLKTDISQTGVADNGLPLYRFRYRDGAQYYEGVMAQDVLAYKRSAVIIGVDGYYRVDYGQLGLSMQPVD